MKGHALTLNLIGAYLRDAYAGDILKRNLIKLEEADAEEQSGHAFRAMDAYVAWFESDGEKGLRALAMLRLMGLFDRPANAGCLEALRLAPANEGLTEPLTTLSEAQRNIVLTRLADAKLVTVIREASGALVSLDAHPLLREYSAKHLRETRAEAWKAAHRRLYEHLIARTPDKEVRRRSTICSHSIRPWRTAATRGCSRRRATRFTSPAFCAVWIRVRGIFTAQGSSGPLARTSAPSPVFRFALAAGCPQSLAPGPILACQRSRLPTASAGPIGRGARADACRSGHAGRRERTG